MRLLLLCLPMAALAQGVSGTYKDCDPAIHDKLVGAQFRSPSDCEIKFDNDLREALRKAFEPMVTALAADQWIKPQSQPKELMGVARSIQQNPYRPDFTNRGGFGLTFNLDPHSEQAQKLAKEMNDALEKAAAQFKATGKMPDDLARIAQKTQEGTKLHIGVSVNVPTDSTFNFSGDHRPLTVPGASFAIVCPRAQASTGGGESAALQAALIYFGSWSKPAVEKMRDGESIKLAGVFNKTVPVLAVQTLRIRVEGGAEMIDKVVKTTDWGVLERLVGPASRPAPNRPGGLSH
jgi:hypothetical protein